MSSQEIMEKVMTLIPEEQQYSQRLLGKRSAQRKKEAKMETFHQTLLSSGLVKSFEKTPVIMTERKLIQVKGKSLSETIIEERR